MSVIRASQNIPGDEANPERLVTAFQQGNRDAATAIYKRYAPRVRALCRHLLLDPDEAEEACQETFLRAFRALPGFNGRYQLGAWLCRIARNVCIDRLRSSPPGAVSVVPPDELEAGRGAAWAPEGESSALRQAQRKEIRDTLSELSGLQRAAVVLRDLEGLTYQEIAVALEVSEAHVKTLIFRGRRRYSVIEEAGTSKRFAGALLRFIAGSVGESPVGALSAAYSQL